MAKSRAATSYDVARDAGVSQATVSAVLTGRQGSIRVSEATRQRVLAAARALHYSPNTLAQALRRQRSGIIGFVPPPAPASRAEPPLPIMHLLGLHVARAAVRRGYHVLEASPETATTRGGEELVEFLFSRRVDGMIFDRPHSPDDVQCFLDRGVPVVQLLRPRLSVATITVTVDPEPGITAAIEHLAALGHRRIAVLGKSLRHPVDQARLDCFRAALARQELALPEEYVQLGRTYGTSEGYALTRALLALPVRPTALFAASEGLALGALRALYAAGVRVPDAMSLISYDDTFAAYLYPPVTSVAQPVEEVAERAVALILERLDSPDGVATEPARVSAYPSDVP
jgi:DNA-binding LacI/PurR family transcriptional regulator